MLGMPPESMLSQSKKLDKFFVRDADGNLSLLKSQSKPPHVPVPGQPNPGLEAVRDGHNTVLSFASPTYC